MGVEQTKAMQNQYAALQTVCDGSWQAFAKIDISTIPPAVRPVIESMLTHFKAMAQAFPPELRKPPIIDNAVATKAGSDSSGSDEEDEGGFKVAGKKKARKGPDGLPIPKSAFKKPAPPAPAAGTDSAGAACSNSFAAIQTIDTGHAAGDAGMGGQVAEATPPYDPLN